MSRAIERVGEESPARSARWVAAGILLSRLAGLVRERVFAAYFANSLFADALKTSLRLPNFLQNLLGEGTLSASFIPVYAELLEAGREEEAGRVAGAIFALLAAIAGGLSLLGIFLAPVMVDVFAPGFEGLQRDLTVTCTRIIFPMTGFLVLSAWALGILNSHRRFFVSYVAPVVWNAAIIAALILFGGRVDLTRLVVATAWGAFLGGVLQFAIQLPLVIRLERDLKIRWGTRLEGVRTTIRNAGPAIAGRGVVQLSGYVDVFLASWLVAGSVAALTYAQTLYLLPISLFGMSVAAAELPELSRRRGGEIDVMRQRVNAGLRRIAFLVVPSFVGYLVLGDVVVAALYQTGDFGPGDTLLVYLVLAAYAIGLLASTGTRLFSSTFFALQDTRTPAKVAALRVAISAAGGLGLMLVFRQIEVAGRSLGPVGLALAAGVGAWIEWGVLRRSLGSRLGEIGAGADVVGRMLAAAALAAVVGRAVDWLLPPVPPLVAAVLVLGPYALTYFAFAHIFGLAEAAAYLRGLAARLRR